MQMPVTVLNASTKREQGKRAQLGNIVAAKVRASQRAADKQDLQHSGPAARTYEASKHLDGRRTGHAG